MTPILTLDTDDLARHTLRLGREVKALRPVNFRLDSEGINLSVALPGPDWLAALLALVDLDVFSGPAVVSWRILTARTSSLSLLNVPALADDLREILRALPDRPDAGEPYTDLRLAAGTSSARFAEYVLDVVRAFVRSCPTVPAVTRPEAPRPEPMTPLERKHAERARRRAEERASARWALTLFLDDDDAPAPGSRVSGVTVFDFVDEALAYAAERYEETVLDPDPRDEDLYRSDRAGRLDAWAEVCAEEWEIPPTARPRRVSRRVLFEVADDLGLFHITRTSGSVVLTIVRRLVRRLKEATVNVLRYAAEILGDDRDPETYADAVTRRIGRPEAPEAPDAALVAIAEALPFPVASAMASAEDPRKALGLVGEAGTVADLSFGTSLPRRRRCRCRGPTRGRAGPVVPQSCRGPPSGRPR